MALTTVGRTIATIRKGNEIVIDKANIPSTNTASDVDFTETIGRKGDAMLLFPRANGSIAAVLRGISAGNAAVAGKADTTPLANMELWTIDGGAVIIRDIIGIVTTTAIGAGACNCKITYDPDDGGADVDLFANVDIDAQPTGAIIRATGDISDDAIISLDVAEASGYDANKGGIVISAAGDIKVIYSATPAGQVNWFIRYTSLGGVLSTIT